LPRKRCALLNSFMAQSFHKDTIQFCIFSGYPVDRSDLVHTMNVWLFHAICRIAESFRAMRDLFHLRLKRERVSRPSTPA
jgi:hypothetical protein